MFRETKLGDYSPLKANRLAAWQGGTKPLGKKSSVYPAQKRGGVRQGRVGTKKKKVQGNPASSPVPLRLLELKKCGRGR